MADVLSTQLPVKPGVYIGRVFRPNPTGQSGIIRQPCAVGKGNRLQTRANRSIRRSYLADVDLTFSPASPYLAPLVFPALPDKTIALIRRLDGSFVPDNKWDFIQSVPMSGVYDTILISPDAYDANESYSISYQSTSRLVQDDISTLFPQLRRILFSGDAENQTLYVEGRDFRIPIDITDVDPASSGSVANYSTRAFSPVVPGTGNTGGGVLSIDPLSAFTADYNRVYTVTVDTVALNVTCSVRISLGSGGNEVLGPDPIHSAIASTLTLTFTAGGVSTDSFIDPRTGDTITVELDDTVPAAVNDTFVFSGLGPARVEVSSAHINTNQFGVVGDPVPDVGNTGTGDVTVSIDSDFDAPYNRTYEFQVTAAAGVGPARTTTLRWVGYGELPITEGTVNLTEALDNFTGVDIENGVILDFDFGVTNFATGDRFTVACLAARKDIEAKDSRTVTLNVATATAGLVTGQYVTNTFEGRFGLFNVTSNGLLQLNGGIDLFFRNIGTVLAQNRHATSDVWEFSTTNMEVFDWGLVSRVTETIDTIEFRTDVLGLMTGVVGSTYVVLSEVPTSVLYVRDTVSGALITSNTISGQPIIYFATAPSNAVEIRYQYVGPEPTPGNIYYVTADVVRPPELYNNVVYAANFEQASDLLGPSSTDNDLLIGAQIGLQDNGSPGMFFVQAYDNDQDGVITSLDLNDAILATERSRRLTDVIVLNGFSTLSTQLASNERMNDPFQAKERALWVGCPMGTVVGDVDTPGTIVFLAKRTLQVAPDSQAHGKRVLVANNEDITKTIRLTDGTTATVNLDGSFVALALACYNASFTTPDQTLLRKNISGFDTMGVFSEPEELRLVGASTVWLSNQGSDIAPVFRIEDSVTVDTSSDDNNEISVAINQKEYVTRDIREFMDASAIGFVPRSEQAAVQTIKTFLVQRLATNASKGFIGPYRDEAGNERPIDPAVDVEVFRDTSSRSTFFFQYYWYGIYPIKRLMGLFSVDERFFNRQA